jgi:hypothetical protein
MATIVLVGTLDTKGDEYAYLRDRIGEQGCDVVLVDVGVLGMPRAEAMARGAALAGRTSSFKVALPLRGRVGRGSLSKQPRYSQPVSESIRAACSAARTI